MGLPNDVSRCVGMIDRAHPHPEFCPHRATCKRYLQIGIDRKAYEHANAANNTIAGSASTYVGTVRQMYSTITNCLVDGEYTMRMPT